MALKSKTSLKVRAEENTQITRGQKNDQSVLKKGNPLDHSVKHLANVKTVGVSLGLTKNMDNYESLRVDVWLTDTVKEDETEAQAFSRVSAIADETLTELVNQYV